MNSESSSVTRWIAQLKQGDDEAARNLWVTYFERLQQAARKRLGTAPKHVADEEDVAVDVFHSLCRGAAEGRFKKLSDRQDLWMLLLTITRQKSADEIRRRTRQKRGGGEVRGESVFAAAGGQSTDGGINGLESNSPDPAILVAAEEHLQHLLSLLRNDRLRRIAGLRMEGSCSEEIANELRMSDRSIRRKLALIRETWESELEDDRESDAHS